MELKVQIENDYRQALKEHNDFKVSLLRMLKSSLKNLEIEKGKSITEDEIIIVFQKQAKQRRDSIEQYKAGGRNDLAKTEQAELILIEAYLPEKLSKEEVEKVVEAAIKKLGATSNKEMGLVIREVMTISGNKTDGKTVSDIVKTKLS